MQTCCLLILQSCIIVQWEQLFPISLRSFQTHKAISSLPGGGYEGGQEGADKWVKGVL